MVLGSCFADEIGTKMKAAGFDVMVNPFGTVYNPISIKNAIDRLDSGKPFTEEDCVPMGANAGLICSWYHHTSFAKATAEEFLQGANAALTTASAHWHSCNKVVLTLGTAMVWQLNSNSQYGQKNTIVSNCLKRPASEFDHRMLSLEECSNTLNDIVNSHPDKEFIFTVSPIRHLGEGAHLNTLSKSTLQLSTADKNYFPAYEILLDELRDYRFYAEDLVHPGKIAVDIIWDRFLQALVPESEHETIKANERASRRSAHRPIH